jgi:multidrug efflux system membrane fusion protein
VTTAAVQQRDVPVEVAAIGNVEAFESVSVRSQVTGMVNEVMFHEGDFVKKGDQLFTIDPRPYQALLEQAKANLVRDEALLAQSQAQLARDQAQSDYLQQTNQRNAELAERGILSKDMLQQSQAQAAANVASVKADQAAVESARAQLGAQQAAVDTASVQLTYTIIRSPINGRTGNLTMKPGNLATANTTELTTIAQVEPVYVTFAVPATRLAAIRGHDTRDPLTVSALPQDENTAPASGALTFVDNAVDTTTDTIKLKARFDNTDHRLWPGEFARVTLKLATLSNALVVSSEAVQTGQDGPFVFVVKPDATVEQRAVTITQRVGDDVVIGQGLKPGETVVTEGQLRLEPGSRIQQPGAGGGGERGGQRGGGGRGRRGGGAAADSGSGS